MVCEGHQQKNPGCEAFKGNGRRAHRFTSSLRVHEEPGEQKGVDRGRRSRRSGTGNLPAVRQRLWSYADRPYPDGAGNPLPYLLRIGERRKATDCTSGRQVCMERPGSCSDFGKNGLSGTYGKF